jgi:FdhE protein
MTPPRTIADPVDIGKVAAPPPIRPPDPRRLFACRAERFAYLASTSPLGDFLSFMGAIADGQAAALAALPELAELEICRRQGAPPLDRRNWWPEASWRRALAVILDRLGGEPLTAETRSAAERLSHAPSTALDALAHRVVCFENGEAEAAEGCLVFAALQVCWTAKAGVIEPSSIALPDQPGICPVCSSPPVASIVHSAGSLAGSRFLVCSLCATERHLVRIKCANCDSTKGIAYLEIEGGHGLVKAETCDECRTYTKIVYTERDPSAEPFADDLASLELDMLVDAADWRRAAPNPFLVPGAG